MLFIETVVTFGLFVEFGVLRLILSAVEVPKHLIISWQSDDLCLSWKNMKHGFNY